MRSFFIILFFILFQQVSFAQLTTVKIAVVKYNGGGDWYANPTSLKNLISFCNKNLGTNINKVYSTVELGSNELYNYPFIHLTGQEM